MHNRWTSPNCILVFVSIISSVEISALLPKHMEVVAIKLATLHTGISCVIPDISSHATIPKTIEFCFSGFVNSLFAC
jgi:hypothetical protein